MTATKDYDLVHEPLPAYSSTWGSDTDLESEPKKAQPRVGWVLVWDSVKSRSVLVAQNTVPFLQKTVWPAIRRFRFTKKQVYAFLLLALLALLPFILVALASGGLSYGSGPFTSLFDAKTITCGDAFGTPQNSTVGGVEALFVLDFTFGKLPFSQVKIIDVVWDVVMGRGAQLLAWWVSYIVFCDALLRVIERHPATYETFTHITIQGAGFSSLLALFKDLFRTKSKRTWTLFFFMFLSTIYVLSLQTILSAMTGYVNTTIAWVDVDQSNQIVPASSFTYGSFFYSLGNMTMNKTCVDGLDGLITDSYQFDSDRRDYCDCKLPNGTVMPYQQWSSRYSYNDAYRSNYTYTSCVFNFTENTQTYYNSVTNKTEQCKRDYTFNYHGKDYNIWQANYSSGYCYDDHGYEYSTLKLRCLPDTANQTYQWGFSTMLSGIFIILQFSWSIVMYIVWQDAQFNSKLVKSGYRMNLLRAAFAASVAAKWKTGMGGCELVRTDKKSLERSLYGTKKKKYAEVEYDVFVSGKEARLDSSDEEGELRRRNSRNQDD
ncbi:hypothetical protein EJ04DRAFT_486074 [Polyplosphaeria fusca]|uniref:Uncharacterized protein n=1 Tax=Polyplosphaeria fusca TaxID=682080 RepID=A0A9P4R877_9PLEO|nr:hypothetical protein EJ04DRAFT_486074 [Polyplosphaeria fusca]